MTQEQRLSRVEKWAKIIISLLILTILIAIYIILFSKHNSYNDKELRNSIDSMRIHDRDKTILINKLESRIQQDSIRYTSIQQQVSNVPTMINAIKHKYDIQRNHITTLTANQQLELFTDWLSQTDSL